MGPVCNKSCWGNWVWRRVWPYEHPKQNTMSHSLMPARLLIVCLYPRIILSALLFLSPRWVVNFASTPVQGGRKGKIKNEWKVSPKRKANTLCSLWKSINFCFYFFLLCRRPYIISLWPPLNPLLPAWDLFPSAPYFTQAKMLFYITFN